MRGYKQEVEHELIAMLVVAGGVLVVFVGLLGALLFLAKDWLF